MVMQSIEIFTDPLAAWRELADRRASLLGCFFTHTVPWALVPAACWYFGVTEVGWQVGLEPKQKMTPESALAICLLFYFAMLAGVLFLGYMVHWMAETYAAADSSVAKGVTIVTYTATPFFLAGLLGLYPSLWIDIAVGSVVAAYCIYLLYVGVPIMMGVAPERGFLFASALVAVALVAIVALMGTTAILWDFGAEPVYTY
jgi:Yip1 domain